MKVQKVPRDKQPVWSTPLYETEEIAYVLSKAEYERLDTMLEQIQTTKQRLVSKLIQDSDPRIAKITEIGIIGSHTLKPLVNELSVMILIYDRNLKNMGDVTLKSIWEETVKTPDYLLRMLTDYGIQVPNTKPMSKPTTTDSNQLNEIILKLKQKEKQLLLREQKLNQQTYKTNPDDWAREMDTQRYLKELDNLGSREKAKIKTGNMEIYVIADYKDEIEEYLQNPAIALEYLASRLPHLLPLIYKQGGNSK